MDPYTRKACGPCIALKARCSQTRPCDRCTRKGLECADVVRKPRTKKPKQPPIVMNAAEIISKLLPTLSPSDLRQLNIPSLQSIAPSSPSVFTATSTTTTFTPSYTPTASLPSSSTSLSPSSSSSFSPSSFSPSSSTSFSPSPLSPTPSPPLDTLQLEQELFGNPDNLPDLEFHSLSTTFAPPQTASLQLFSSTSSHPSSTPRHTSFTSAHTSFTPNHTSLTSSPLTPLTSTPLSSTHSCTPSSLTSTSLTSTPHTSLTLFSPPPSNSSQPLDTLGTIDPQTELQTISTTVTSTLSGALMNLVRRLVTASPPEAHTQVENELQFLKGAIEDFLTYAQSSRPIEINVQPPVFIANPGTLTIKDCNENLLKLIGCDAKEQLLNGHITRLCIPQFWRIIKRDIAWFFSQNIRFAERYITLQHRAGGVVYAMASFQLVGPDNAIITIKHVLDDIPRCLQIAFYHYMGLASANQRPEPQNGCPIKYCHCKMFHLPIPPPDP